MAVTLVTDYRSAPYRAYRESLAIVREADPLPPLEGSVALVSQAAEQSGNLADSPLLLQAQRGVGI